MLHLHILNGLKMHHFFALHGCADSKRVTVTRVSGEVNPGFIVHIKLTEVKGKMNCAF
jgi:hypothetical protein